MPSRINFFKLVWLWPILLILSCIEAPVEVMLSKKVEISEAKVNEIADNILKEIIQASNDDFTPSLGPGHVDTKECVKSFKEWITEEFKKGFVPKRVIKSAEYMASSTAPYKEECPNIDLGKEFSQAKEKIDLSDLGKTEYISFEELRKVLSEEGPCAINFMDPDKRKLSIRGLTLTIEKNTLNMPLPLFEIFYTTVPLTADEVKAPGAVKTLKAAGTLKEFAMSPELGPGALGTFPFEVIKDYQAYERAQEKLNTLKSELIAVPTEMNKEIKTRDVGGTTYYIIPRGSVMMSIALQATVFIEGSDVLCVMQYLKQQSKEHHKR